eukprot:COSAG06_NODE_1258_length_10078_cov_2.895280_8_plen_135_part_00
MIEFAKTGSGQSRGKPFKTNMAFVAGKEAAFDRIFLSEDVIHDGQLVANYTVDACSGATGDKRPPPLLPPLILSLRQFLDEKDQIAKTGSGQIYNAREIQEAPAGVSRRVGVRQREDVDVSRERQQRKRWPDNR